MEEETRVRLECFGTGILQWTSSTGLEIPSDMSGNVYQSYDHTRDALALVIRNFTTINTAVYTCASDLDNVLNNGPVLLSLLITNCECVLILSFMTLYFSLSLSLSLASPSVLSYQVLTIALNPCTLFLQLILPSSSSQEYSMYLLGIPLH